MTVNAVNDNDFEWPSMTMIMNGVHYNDYERRTLLYNDHDWRSWQWSWIVAMTINTKGHQWQWSWMSSMTMIMNIINEYVWIGFMIMVEKAMPKSLHSWACPCYHHGFSPEPLRHDAEHNGGVGSVGAGDRVTTHRLTQSEQVILLMVGYRRCLTRRPGYHTPPDTVRTSYSTEGGVGGVWPGDRVTKNRLT